MHDPTFDRRSLLVLLGSGLATVTLAPASALAAPPSAGLVTKKIPSSGVQLPVIGMGTWITFNVGNDEALRAQRAHVLRTFLDGGGALIDSSPMYGSSQSVLGHGLARLGERAGRVFSADKIWTSDGAETVSQLVRSRTLWRVPRFDLVQVHNLVAWREHLPVLQQLRREGKIGHVGVTTSHGRRHEELEQILKTQELDFVQLTYNAVDREAERRLLPLAADRGVAVIANRPFQRGALVRRLQGHSLPGWAREELGCTGWPQVLLKLIVSHPAVTCAIPATSRVDHVRVNLGAARGPMPDAKQRTRMLSHLASL